MASNTSFLLYFIERRSWISLDVSFYSGIMIAHDWNTCLLIFHLCSAGRDGLTHNMLNDIHNNWKHAEAVRIKCMGVPTVDMKNVCTQLEVSPSFKFNDIHFLCFLIPSCYCSSSELSCLNRYLFTLFMVFIL